MESIAPCDEVTVEFLSDSLLSKFHFWRGFNSIKTNRLGVEMNFSAVFQPRRDQILNHFMLPVDGNPLAIRQISEINPVPSPLKAQLDPMVHESFFV